MPLDRYRTSRKYQLVLLIPLFCTIFLIISGFESNLQIRLLRLVITPICLSVWLYLLILHCRSRWPIKINEKFLLPGILMIALTQMVLFAGLKYLKLHSQNFEFFDAGLYAQRIIAFSKQPDLGFNIPDLFEFGFQPALLLYVSIVCNYPATPIK